MNHSFHQCIDCNFIFVKPCEEHPCKCKIKGFKGISIDDISEDMVRTNERKAKLEKVFNCGDWSNILTFAEYEKIKFEVEYKRANEFRLSKRNILPFFKSSSMFVARFKGLAKV